MKKAHQEIINHNHFLQNNFDWVYNLYNLNVLFSVGIWVKLALFLLCGSTIFNNMLNHHYQTLTQTLISTPDITPHFRKLGKL